MRSKKIILIITLMLIPVFAFTIDISTKIGGSTITYAEKGPYKKDNLYEIKSLLVGPAAYYRFKYVELYNYFAYQLPNEVSFKDALGEDPTNYIEGKFFYGFNNNLGALYPIELSVFTISPGLYFNFEYIYMKDEASGEEFIYSIMGNGVSLDLTLNLGKYFAIGASSGVSYNYLPLYDRGTDLIYSYSYFITGVIELRL